LCEARLCADLRFEIKFTNASSGFYTGKARKPPPLKADEWYKFDSFLYCGILTTMKTQTTKIWLETLKKLRMIYALTGEKMTVILDRLVDAELARLNDTPKQGK